MRRAASLDRATVPNWLHTVVRREAMALRRARQRLVATEDAELDVHQAPREPTSEDRVLSLHRSSRAAEALGGLKPQEIQALWLRAQGVVQPPIPERRALLIASRPGAKSGPYSRRMSARSD